MEKWVVTAKRADFTKSELESEIIFLRTPVKENYQIQNGKLGIKPSMIKLSDFFRYGD